MPRQQVTAIIQAAGLGQRLGMGPKAFVPLAGRTLLERAIESVRGSADEVVVAVPVGALERARGLGGVRDVAVIEGGTTRSETTRRLVDWVDSSEFILIHDVAHPFVTSALCRAVLEAAHATGAAAAAAALLEFAYDADGQLAAAPGDLFVVHKPVACRHDLLLSGYAALDAGLLPPVTHDRGVMELLAAAGTRWRFVASPADNLKLTSVHDLRLAQRLAADWDEGR